MAKSNIEWTQETWNPIIGCSLKSPGCTNCYAMPMAARIEAANAAARAALEATGQRMPIAAHYDGTTRRVKGKPVWTGKLAMAPDSILLAPLKRKKPTTYFVNSMGDLFHEDCPDEWIDRVFAVMALCPQHTFQVLTKRAARMRDYFLDDRVGGDPPDAGWLSGARASYGIRDALQTLRIEEMKLTDDQWSIWDSTDRVILPLPNIWLGVSTERQQEADERIPLLLRTPAAVRFISAEPLLGPISLQSLCGGTLDALLGHDFEAIGDIRDGGDLSKTRHPPGLDWAIVGGESGPSARPMHPEWARSLRDECKAAGVPFFFKQWGRWAPTHPDYPMATPHAVANDGTVYFSPDIAYPDGARYSEAIRAGRDKAHLTSMYPIGKAKAGRLLDDKEYNGMPQPRSATP